MFVKLGDTFINLEQVCYIEKEKADEFYRIIIHFTSGVLVKSANNKTTYDNWLFKLVGNELYK